MYNRSILIGRLTRDPELKYTPDGTAVASFTLAVPKRHNREKTDFINCIAWRKTAEFISNYFAKGKAIGVEGYIQSRTYKKQDDSTAYITEVVAEQAFFVEKKDNHDQSRSSSQDNDHRRDRERSQDQSMFTGGQTIDIEDDDLPF